MSVLPAPTAQGESAVIQYIPDLDRDPTTPHVIDILPGEAVDVSVWIVPAAGAELTFGGLFLQFAGTPSGDPTVVHLDGLTIETFAWHAQFDPQNWIIINELPEPRLLGSSGNDPIPQDGLELAAFVLSADAPGTWDAPVNPEATDGQFNPIAIDSGEMFTVKAFSNDCNENGVSDTYDILSETSEDCDGGGIPDECQSANVDCNGNGAWDICDIVEGESEDCNGNDVPDECEILPTLSSGQNLSIVWNNGPANGVDGVRPQANWDPHGILDDFTLFEGASAFSHVRVEIIDGTFPLGVPDTVHEEMRIQIYELPPDGLGGLSYGSDAPVFSRTYARDAGTMTVADSGIDMFNRDLLYIEGAGAAADLGPGDYAVQLTFPGSGPVASYWAYSDHDCSPGFDCGRRFGPGVNSPFAAPSDLAFSLLLTDPFSADCNENGVPDECDIDGGESDDCDLDGFPDECFGDFMDCNDNAQSDLCDILDGVSDDCDGNNIPDECQSDCDNDGEADMCELMGGLLNGDFGAAGQGWNVASLNEGPSADIVTGGGAVTVTGPDGGAVGGYLEIWRAFSVEPSAQTITIAFDLVSYATEDTGNAPPYDSPYVSINGQAWGLNENGTLVSGLTPGAGSRNGYGNVGEGDGSAANVHFEMLFAPGQDGVVRLALGRDSSDNLAGPGVAIFDNVVVPESLQDCNLNGMPDSCDVDAGAEDCNGNQLPDTCEGDLRDCNGNGVVDDCEFGDFDGGGTVDLQDFRQFFNCMSPPGGGVGYGCAAFDTSCDGDVDLHDFAALQDYFHRE